MLFFFSTILYLLPSYLPLLFLFSFSFDHLLTSLFLLYFLSLTLLFTRTIFIFSLYFPRVISPCSTFPSKNSTLFLPIFSRSSLLMLIANRLRELSFFFYILSWFSFSLSPPEIFHYLSVIHEQSFVYDFHLATFATYLFLTMF